MPGKPNEVWTRATHLTSLGGASGRDPGGSLQSAQFQQHLAPGALQDHSTHVDVSSHLYPLKHTFTYFREPDATIHIRALIHRANPIELNSAERVQPNNTGSMQPHSSQCFPQFHQLAQCCSFFLPCSEHFHEGLFTRLPKCCK